MTMMSAEKSATAFYKGRVFELITLDTTGKTTSTYWMYLPQLENYSSP